ncbi:MAG: XdhC family protein [Chthoniobacterales bacterium]
MTKELQDIIRAYEARRGEKFALATLVRTQGSSYRRPGARLLIATDGSYVGALSGGCLEEEVAARAQTVIANGVPAELHFDTRLRYGCNGAIDILVEKLSRGFLEGVAEAFRARRVCFAATDSLGSRLLHSVGEALNDAFVQEIAPPLQLLLIGAGPDSPALRAFAQTLGWKVIETEEAAALPNDFDEWTAAIVKTHNYGRDFAALQRLLPLGLRYVALLGPRRRRDRLLQALAEAGLETRSGFFAPAGLDLGAEAPEQIALAMVAEIQSVFAHARGESLRERKAPIHSPVAQVSNLRGAVSPRHQPGLRKLKTCATIDS